MYVDTLFSHTQLSNKKAHTRKHTRTHANTLHILHTYTHGHHVVHTETGKSRSKSTKPFTRHARTLQTTQTDAKQPSQLTSRQ